LTELLKTKSKLSKAVAKMLSQFLVFKFQYKKHFSIAHDGLIYSSTIAHLSSGFLVAGIREKTGRLNLHVVRCFKLFSN
jgi:hypothetical protein